MSSPEMAEWIAFERQYDLPDGFFVGGVNWQMWAGKDSQIGDTVPYYRRKPRQQTAAEQKAIMAALRGGRV